MRMFNSKSFVRIGMLSLFLMSYPGITCAQGLMWPTNQLLPTFSKLAPVLDCIDTSSSSNPEIDLFASLQGIVNRTQPQIITVTSGDGEGKFTWVAIHNLNY